jgi:hypothetical protein
LASYQTFAETLNTNPTQIITALNAAFESAGIDLAASFTGGMWKFNRVINGVSTTVMKMNDSYPIQVMVNNGFTALGSTSYFDTGGYNYYGICTTTDAVALVFGGDLAHMHHFVIFGKNENNDPCVVINRTSGDTSPIQYPEWYNLYAKVLDKTTGILSLSVTTVFINNVFSAFEVPVYVGTRIKNVFRCVSGLTYYYDATIGRVGEKSAALICGNYVLTDS